MVGSKPLHALLSFLRIKLKYFSTPPLHQELMLQLIGVKRVGYRGNIKSGRLFKLFLPNDFCLHSKTLMNISLFSLFLQSSKNIFYHLIFKSPNRQIGKLTNWQIIKSSNHLIGKLANYFRKMLIL